MGVINQLMTGGHHPVVFHKSPSDGLYEVLVRRDEGWSLDILRHQMSAVQVAAFGDMATTSRYHYDYPMELWAFREHLVDDCWGCDQNLDSPFWSVIFHEGLKHIHITTWMGHLGHVHPTILTLVHAHGDSSAEEFSVFWNLSQMMMLIFVFMVPFAWAGVRGEWGGVGQ